MVSSRIADYDTLGMRLTLGAALLVQPLTRGQIEEYLDRLGAPLAGVRLALATDPTLWELLQTPFLLSVAVRAYEGLSASELSVDDSLDERRARLFNAFVHRSLRAKPRLRSYGEHDTVRWLAYIARSLGQRLETVFYLEFVDIGWLTPARQRTIIACSSLPVVPLVGGSVGLLMWLLAGHWQGIAAGVLGALVYGIPLSLASSMAIPHHHQRRWRSQLVNILAGWSAIAFAMALGALLVAGLPGAIIGAIVGPFTRMSFFGAILEGGLTGALAVFLLILPISAVIQPLSTDRTRLRDRRVGADLRDTARLGAALLLIFGGSSAVMLSTNYGPLGTFTGAVVGLTASYLYSGRPLIGYWLARLLLSRAGVVPFKQVTFLDFAASRMLMHKVGGGYIFAHRLLLEYFAQITVEGLARHQKLVQLPVVDLRPEAVLARALADAKRGQDSVLRMLTYAGTFLSPAQFAPVTMQIAEIMRAKLPDSTPSKSVPSDALALETQVDSVADIYQLLINAGHRELSPKAALDLGELLDKYADMANRSMRSFPQTWEKQARQAFTAAARSGHPMYAPLAAQRLRQTPDP